MRGNRRSSRSAYMEWAKLRAGARFDLAGSDVGSLRLADFPASAEEILAALELTGAAGYGHGPLIERIAAKAGVEVDRVVLAAGTSMANHLAFAALLEPGDEVLIESPTYEILVDVARYLGAEVRRFRRRFEDGWAVDPEEIARATTARTRLVVLTNLHNPSGVRTPDPTIGRAAEIVADRGARLLVDEVYLDACFDPAARSAVHLGPNVLVTASLTKAYGLSGLRCGWVLAPSELAGRMRRLGDLHEASAAHPAERLAVLAFDRLDRVAERARDRLTRNRATLDSFLDGRPELSTVRPAGGTIVFPRLADGGVDPFCRRLRERWETSVVPGRFFGAVDHFRVGIGADPAVVEEGLRRLALALQETRSTPA